MNKEQIIEDMAQNHLCKLLRRHCETCTHCSCYEQAERNYSKGYRKQSDTAKEIIQEILDNSHPTFGKDGRPIIEINADLTANLCKKYGVIYD
ncbi:MAG: hypothetical protein LUD27_01840 [Clostridia bacterium]|nr:hypothetical protein [Clostridia bacterium]